MMKMGSSVFYAIAENNEELLAREKKIPFFSLVLNQHDDDDTLPFTADDDFLVGSYCVLYIHS